MRKTKEDTQITKDQILRGSFECFANRGYDWTTIERVAKQVGVSSTEFESHHVRRAHPQLS